MNHNTSHNFSHLSSSDSKVLTFSKPRARYTLTDEKSSKLTEVDEKLGSLCALQENWDGYGGRTIAFENAQFARLLMKWFFDAGIEDVPFIIPGTDGTLQLEWHYEDYSLEIDVEKPYKSHVLIARPNSKEYEEFIMEYDLTITIKNLHSIKEEASNAATAMQG